jgi:hypothetical protein
VAKPKAFDRLYALPEDRLAEVRDRLLRGDTAGSVAQLIQEEWGEAQSVSVESLKRQLCRFHEKVIKPDVMRAIHKPYAIAVAASKIDVIAQLTALIERQQQRFEKLLKKEEGMPLPLGMVSTELDRFHRMLIDLARLQIEIGVLPRAARTLTGLMAAAEIEDGGVTDPSVISFRWTEEAREADRELETLYSALPSP